jgi:hypothetical protein
MLLGPGHMNGVEAMTSKAGYCAQYMSIGRISLGMLAEVFAQCLYALTLDSNDLDSAAASSPPETMPCRSVPSLP